MCWFADVGFFVKKHHAMAALKDPAALVWCSAETVSSKSTQKQTSFVPGSGCLKVDYGRISTKANVSDNMEMIAIILLQFCNLQPV
jgi:hypothetical protein